MRRFAALMAVLVAMLALTTSALADVEGGSSVAPTTILPDVPGSDIATVTLTLEGTTSFEATPTDVYLMLDDSGSISNSEWDIMVNNLVIPTINALVTEGLFDNGGSLGVGTYAGQSSINPTDAYCQSNYGHPCYQHYWVQPLRALGASPTCPSGPTIGDLGTHNPVELTTLIDSLSRWRACGRRMAGYTGTPWAVQRATHAFNNYSAPGNRRVLIVFTDGAYNRGDMHNARDMADAAGVERYVVGIGNGVDIAHNLYTSSNPRTGCLDFPTPAQRIPENNTNAPSLSCYTAPYSHVFFAADPNAYNATIQALMAETAVEGATDIQVQATVDPAWTVSGPATTKGTLTQAGNVLTWSIDDLADGEVVTATYDIATSCDHQNQTLPVHTAITYTGVGGPAPSFDLLSVDVGSCNRPPDVGVDAGAVSVQEGDTAANTGIYTDPDGDPVTLTASVGTVVDEGAGVWSWSWGTGDGPDDSATVTVTATDPDGATDEVTFDLTVTNVAPTADASGSATTGVPSVPVALVGAFTDPAGALDGLYAWTWDVNGDAAPDYSGFATYGLPVMVPHAYAAGGAYIATFTVTDDDGESGSATVTVVVNNPPDCSAAAAALPVLWPPAHGMVANAITGVSDLDGDEVSITITGITSNEDVDALADGATSPDWAIGDDGAFSVRAERAGVGTGRVYTVSFEAADGLSTCTGQVTVTVAHDQGNGKAKGR